MSKRLFAVIHCLRPFGEFRQYSIGHAIKNASIAANNGADGVFLIGHGPNNTEMCYIYQEVRKYFPNLFIGVNFLDIRAEETISMQCAIGKCPGISAVWTDRIPRIHLPYDKRTESFVGVAFKYIEPNLLGQALIEQINKAKKVSNVLTTSGDETGKPPTLKKIQEIRSLAGPGYRLAIASGVSAENVTAFLPYADDFLVADSITQKKGGGEGDDFIPEKVQALAKLIHKA